MKPGFSAQAAISTNVANSFARAGKKSITKNVTYRSLVGDVDEGYLALLRAKKDYLHVTPRMLLDKLVQEKLRLVNDPLLVPVDDYGIENGGRLIQRNPVAKPMWVNQLALTVRFTAEGRAADIGQLTVNVRECPVLKRELESTGNYKKGRADVWEVIDGIQRMSMILGVSMGRIPIVGGDDPPDEGDGDVDYDPQVMVYMTEDCSGKGWKRLMASA